MLEVIAEWRAMRRFHALGRAQRKIVFYSEGAEYWVHLEPLISSLVNDFGQTVCYLSSQSNDPGLALDNPRILPFKIGAGSVRTALFRALDATVMVMTMPDLETLHIKRSVHPVHYVYIFHAAVSTHMVYRKNAFDNFDSLFCVGPHHMAEIRAAEALYGLPPKNLVEHGYGRLDSILRNAEGRLMDSSDDSVPRILIAPSWGGFNCDGLLEIAGGNLVAWFLDAGFHVTLRPHPMSRKLSVKILTEIVRRFTYHARFSYEDNVAPENSLLSADLMLSDWSGAAFDYAFGLERPVLFIDIPRKINNAEYGELGLEPLEAKIRAEIGHVLELERLSAAPQIARQLITDANDFAERIRRSRSRWIYNVGNSARCGAEQIVKICGALSND